jgi:hypothetical protein
MESFEPLKEFPDKYLINKKGEIWSIYSKKLLSTFEGRGGYIGVRLRNGCSRDKSAITRTIHRLLGIQYIENPNNLPFIDHIDRNNKNNSLENLRWVDYIENRHNRADWSGNWTPEQFEERRLRIIEINKKYRAKKKLNN